MAGSLIMEAARKNSVPAGASLAVDRDLFARYITDKIAGDSLIDIIREEVAVIPDGFCIIATGPLTSNVMIAALGDLIDMTYLYFYDAIAPIVSADSIDFTRTFYGSRYGKGGDDYINCPMNEDEYDRFYDELVKADRVSAREFEDARVFEGCMPIEVMAGRGRDTLRFGPLKPVGLADPRSGRRPCAAVQLRAENRGRTAYNMVGFQCRIKWPEQERVFRLIPGLEKAEFLRYGSIHRNTFLDSPRLINGDLSFSSRENVFVAGQLSGVEGYLESTAMGLISSVNAVRKMLGLRFLPVPATSAHGSLVGHVTRFEGGRYQPSNINLGMFPEPAVKTRDRKLKRKLIAERALADWRLFLQAAGTGKEFNLKDLDDGG
jgi:methylenetetrahydrofolate--tRNA-(uracil-5-)-methyltransferase